MGGCPSVSLAPLRDRWSGVETGIACPSKSLGLALEAGNRGVSRQPERSLRYAAFRKPVTLGPVSRSFPPICIDVLPLDRKGLPMRMGPLTRRKARSRG
jgi:hypothetical protein